MRLAPTLLLLSLAFFGQAQQIAVGNWQFQGAQENANDGHRISTYAVDPGDKWQPAVVPGTVLSSLVKNGVYPEPLFGENIRKIPESLSQSPYWYRTSILIPKQFAGKHPWLHFAGINYRAVVWVNGTNVGRIDGAFARGDFDLFQCTTPGKRASIAVLVSPPEHPGVIHYKTQATGTGRNGGEMGADGPTFAAAVGWDWMPGIGDRDTGIWGPVTLDATGQFRLMDPYVTTSLPLPRTDSAKVTIQAPVRNLSDVPESGEITAEIEGAHYHATQPLRLAPGETRTFTFDVTVPHPKLWWPNGYGQPNLYGLRLTVKDGGLSDEKQLKFGIRTIQYFPPGSKELGLIVNGVPVFCKGGNWGMDEAMKRSPRERLDAQIRFHRDANYTMIRNWVGMSTQEDFYDLCDQYGILVWDEFWLANPYDGPNPVDPDLFLANAREKMFRYRNHPSIALWCGRNEGDPPANIEPGLVSLVAELDPPRLYQPHSAHYNGVGGGGPYAMRPVSFYFGNIDRFHTEIGAPSIPTLEGVKAMMPEKDWWPINDDWAEHDFCSGAQGGNRYPSDLAHLYGPVTGLADFVRKAQLADYETYRAIYEGRNSKLFSPATGVLIWMSNPAQPSFVWQLYSYDLEPDAALFGTRKACEPIHVQYDPVAHEIQVINNTPKPLGSVVVRLRTPSPSSLPKELRIAVPASGVGRAKVSFEAPTIQFVELELMDPARRKTLSTNFYILPKPVRSSADVGSGLADLEALPTVGLLVAARPVSAPKGETWIEVTLRNPTSTTALLSHVQLRRAQTGDRVLPAFYTDNYVSLLPGESKTLTVQAHTADLHGQKPLLVLDGWNVLVAPHNHSAIPVFTNTDAVVGPQTAPATAETSLPSGVIWQLRCGADADAGTYRSDEGIADGGNPNTQNYPVDVSALGSNAGPANLYKSERWGEFSYHLPVSPNHRYTVRLTFADLSYKNTGGRKFNVSLNGKEILHEFDLLAEAGGRGKAIARDFPVSVGADGKLDLAFTRGSEDWPEVRTIQVLETP